jgi:hypothetical protein
VADPDNPPPAHGRLQHSRALRERLDGGGCAVALEKEDNLALGDEDMLSLESNVLEVERWPLGDEAPSRFRGAAPNRQNHGDARLRRPFGPEAREQIAKLAHKADPAEGANEHPLARVPLEDDGLLAVDSLADSAPDLDGREVIEWNPEILGLTCAPQLYVISPDPQPSARGQTISGAPDDRVLTGALANALV